MSELKQILELNRRAQADGEEVCLATVVRVEGSSYRKPGARMLLTRGGRKAGTISGGCLEADVRKKAWWLTKAGASVERYSSFYDEESEMPYGLGCGGAVHLLLERSAAAKSLLAGLQYGVDRRLGLAIVSVIAASGGETCGTRLILAEDGRILHGDKRSSWIGEAQRSLEARRSQWLRNATVFIEYAAPPPAVFIFGAGDDAQPFVEFAHSLGWNTTVIDGRSHLVSSKRFPLADKLLAFSSFDAWQVKETDAAVILTHSYDQDRAALRLLLPKELAYLGILGPCHRTTRLLEKIAPEVGMTVDQCRDRLHSPVGLDIGAKDPAAIALAIAAEMQGVFGHAAAQPRVALRAHG